MFKHIVGNDSIKSYLTRTAERGMVGNSLLFAGPKGIGKSLFAEAFARSLIMSEDPQGINKKKLDSGNHPDLQIFRPEGKIAMHSIASMREFSQSVYLTPAESKWKVFIIQEAERMLTYSANALLKTFEEPPKNTLIILVSSKPEAILPTILSRCRTLHFHPIEEQAIADYIAKNHQKSVEEASKIAALAHGSIGAAVRLAQEGGDPAREKLLEILSGQKFKTYKGMTEAISIIADRLEVEKKAIEEEMRASLLAGTNENMTAVQKQAIEKEVEGMAAIYGTQEAAVLFDAVLGWYRDLHLLKLQGNPAFLIHRDYLDVYSKHLNGSIPSLEEVQQHLAAARLAVERSTSIQIALENLFLQLKLL